MTEPSAEGTSDLCARVRSVRRRRCERISADMSSEPNGLRTRVRLAIETPVTESESLLNELTDADVETRLSILIRGWGRGVAAALEELAIAVEELQRTRPPQRAPEPAEPTPIEDQAAEEQAAPEEHVPQANAADRGEEQLADQARRSREETAKLQEETEEVRSELERERRSKPSD